MVATPKKALKLGRAIKSAARLPGKVTSGRIGGRADALSPVQGEQPVVLLRVQVVGCRDLAAKDRNGSSDPFVTLTILGTKHQTPVSKKTVNPDYAPKDATFDFPIHLSLADKLAAVELVVWDKDMLKKDYLGEASITLEEWFDGRALGFADAENEPFSTDLTSTRENTPPTGSIRVKLGFVEPPNTQSLMSFEDVYSELVKRSRPSVMSAPPTAGIGTMRSHQTGPEFEDDGLSSDEEDQTSDDEEPSPPLPSLHIPSLGTAALRQNRQSPLGSPDGGADVRTPLAAKPPGEKTPTASKTTSPGFIPKILRRQTLPAADSSASLGASSSGASSPTPMGTPIPQTPTTARPPARKGKSFRKPRDKSYAFSAEDDIVGIVMLEVQSASDLPRLRNMTRTGWDMDPFVVISFGKKVFRTRVIRHSRNPVWDEKLLFHVRRYETKFNVQLGVLDWDKISSNDHIGDATFNIEELVKSAPVPDKETGLYAPEEDGIGEMKEYQLPLTTGSQVPWESKHSPMITFKAKYQSYDALRQKFWRQYLKQYDADDTNTIARVELTSMLDSLGSTLGGETINSFYTRNGLDPNKDELSIPQTIRCLEDELCRPTNEKKRLDAPDYRPADTVPSTPMMTGGEGRQLGLNLEKMDFAGPPGNMPSLEAEVASKDASGLLKPTMPPAYPTEGMQIPIGGRGPAGALGAQGSPSLYAASSPSMTASSAGTPAIGAPVYPGRITHTSSSGSDAEESSASGSTSASQRSQVERVINVKTCPLCHRPRMNAKAEMDIVTHLAVCASQDWARVDRIVVGNFVTSSQAQRKWMAKLIGKVSNGAYRLGANSANIIVQNRMTGQLEEEKMQVYVRLGIRLLYKGAKSRMEGARARNLLKSLSIKQGSKFNSPESTRDIRPFIDFHRLNVDEILEPIESFKNFNSFFYRKLKPDARPCEEPDNPNRLVSAADCRMMTFETVSDATRLWIKGREFSVARLIGNAYIGQADRYEGGALAIFRLAPQDYHRFHSPVDGTIGPMTYISGEYYTVNPQAVRTSLDIYGENVRKIVPIDSPRFGRVMAVCIGAMMVGSILTTVDEGQQIKRGEEFGYFAFGGSTIVLLFEKGAVEWDEDLVINGQASLETLVRVGMGIGRSVRP